MKYTLAVVVVVMVTSCLLFTFLSSTVPGLHRTRPSNVQSPGRRSEMAGNEVKPLDESQQAAAAWSVFVNGVKADIPKAEAEVLKSLHKPQTFRLTFVRDDAKKSDSLKHACIGELTLLDHLYMGKLDLVGDLHYTNERTYRFGWVDGRWKYLESSVKVIMSPVRSEIGIIMTGSDLSRMDVWERLLFQVAL